MVLFTKPTFALLFLFFATLIPRMFGLTAGFHRYFSHRSFQTSRIFQFILALLGTIALQKDPLWWAAHHRHHHRSSDTIDDTHSPITKGFWWSHIGWILSTRNRTLDPLPHMTDFADYPELVWLSRHQRLPAFCFFVLIVSIGFYFEKTLPRLGINVFSAIAWGFFLSTVFLYHVTFCVNSISHLFGSRRFQTNDHSRNNALVAVLTMGEGWHNNHHRFPSSERQGFYWWEIDLTHLILKGLSFLGLVWNLRTPPQEVYNEAVALKLSSANVQPQKASKNN